MAMSPRLLRPRASGAFTPKSISGLALWLDAADSSTITLNGSNVSSWADKSGTLKPATANAHAATQPAFAATAANGKPQIEFDNNEMLAVGSSTSLFNFLHGGAGATVFIAMRAARTSNPNAFGQLFTNCSNSSSNVGITVAVDDRAGVGRNNALLYGGFRGESGQTVAFAANNSWFASADGLVIATMRFDLSNATVGQRLFSALNGTTTGGANTSSASASTNNASNNLHFGDPGGSSGFSGALSELLIYEGLLSASQRQLVERSLGRKWGVTVA